MTPVPQPPPNPSDVKVDMAQLKTLSELGIETNFLDTLGECIRNKGQQYYKLKKKIIFVSFEIVNTKFVGILKKIQLAYLGEKSPQVLLEIPTQKIRLKF